MVTVILFVGTLILLYSSASMANEDGLCRFFAIMNLFIGFMLILVLANDLLFLFAGREGVGLCSYLLIGFYYKSTDAIRASKKAFIVTRVGDVAFMTGLFYIALSLGTLQIPGIAHAAMEFSTQGLFSPSIAAMLLLIGALGKSAQIPLQIWLPDAMAGPTPVSALIHSATMVTAGVYLIARMHTLFLLAPGVLRIVAVIGVVTLLVAGLAALAQRDIKRVLAYSTISQIGYMFLALGVGAFSAAIFHFFTHAFFKSLLFLSAGVVIQYCNDEHDIFKMHGLRKKIPLTFAAFLFGSCSLAALPFITAGFYSKDLIMGDVWSSAWGGKLLWLCAEAGALLTGLYTFRVVFKVFFGTPYKGAAGKIGARRGIPLVVLSLFCIAAALFQIPLSSAPHGLFGLLIERVLPAPNITEISGRLKVSLRIVSAVVSVGGILFAWAVYAWKPGRMKTLEAFPAMVALAGFFRQGAGFDALYARAIVAPFVRAIRNNRKDFTLFYVKACTILCAAPHYALSLCQTGKVRWYAMTIALGAAAILAMEVFL
jgi:NADH-quinone oxidoreductase subunit L